MKHTNRSPEDDLAAGISRVLFTQDEIAQRVWSLGQAISDDYAGQRPLLVGVLKGVFIFMADLCRTITISADVDFISISSYSHSARERGVVRLEKDLEEPISGRHVVFVEDMIDTGLTLHYILRNLQARDPASIEVCALFNKSKRRLIDLPIKYKGFDLPDRFVVGYGLDYEEKYRNLPYVGLLKPEIFQKTQE